MRGITSQAMVMCSSTEDRKTFEVLDPPDSSVPGDRVSFEGYPGDPEKQLNPKKKVNIASGLDIKKNCILSIICSPFQERLSAFQLSDCVVFSRVSKLIHICSGFAL